MSDMELANRNGGAIAVSDQHEIQAMRSAAEVRAETEGKIIIAKKFPRDEIKARTDLDALAGRYSFAENGFYSFPRGTSTVTGASIKLMKAVAQKWGNIVFKIVVVDEDDEHVTLRAVAWDMENNLISERDRRIKKLIQRKKWVDGEQVTQWIEPAEREKLELYGREGSKALRGAIEDVIPADVVEDVKRKCMDTVANPPTNDSMTRDQRIIQHVGSFRYWGITPEVIAETYGVHTVGQLSNEDMVDLVGRHARLKDGEARDTVFTPKSRMGSSTGAGIDLGKGEIVDEPPKEPKKPAKKKTTRDQDGKPISHPDAEPPEDGLGL